MMATLTLDERDELRRHEQTVERNRRGWDEARQALAAIKTKGLHRDLPWEEYVTTRWGVSSASVDEPATPRSVPPTLSPEASQQMASYGQETQARIWARLAGTSLPTADEIRAAASEVLLEAAMKLPPRDQANIARAADKKLEAASRKRTAAEKKDHAAEKLRRWTQKLVRHAEKMEAGDFGDFGASMGLAGDAQALATKAEAWLQLTAGKLPDERREEGGWLFPD